MLERHPFVRFTVVGDGLLRAPLEALAARLRISWAVHFTGWVGAQELPGVLAGLDAVVSAGLVLETFCIANIEVMAMQLPLVTFALGGTGEYVLRPLHQQQQQQQQHEEEVVVDNVRASRGVEKVNGKRMDEPVSVDEYNDRNNKLWARDRQSSGERGSEEGSDFSVSGNAVVVHKAAPEALASAVLHLINHPALCRELGEAGRQTVIQRFGVDRQMKQYDELYSKLQF